MAVYQTLQIGRLTMRENFDITESSDGNTRKLSLSGRESMGAMGQRTRLQVEQRRDDILNIVDQLVAVVFTDKTSLTGFYFVTSSSAKLTEWDGGQWAILDWTADLVRVGADNEIDLESRLSGSVTRVNDFSLTGKRYHAPPVNANVYWAGSTTPLFIDRVGSDGTVRVYRDLAATVNPRWGIAASDYSKGRVRFLDNQSRERVGVAIKCSATTWELSNSIIRITQGSGSNTFNVYAWEAGAWSLRSWDIRYGVSPVVVISFDSVSVLDNTFESITVRLVKDLAPGRMVLDLTLKRGASIVSLYIQHEFSTTLEVKRTGTVAGTSGTGYIYETTPDGNGFRSIVGSARTFTGTPTSHSISKASTATLDAFLGVSISVSAGNAVADIMNQYLGFPGEVVRGVRR